MLEDDACAQDITATFAIRAPTAIADPGLAYGLMLYPNPTTGKVQLQLPAGLRATLTVTDVSGRIIR